MPIWNGAPTGGLAFVSKLTSEKFELAYRRWPFQMVVLAKNLTHLIEAEVRPPLILLSRGVARQQLACGVDSGSIDRVRATRRRTDGERGGGERAHATLRAGGLSHAARATRTRVELAVVGQRVERRRDLELVVAQRVRGPCRVDDVEEVVQAADHRETAVRVFVRHLALRHRGEVAPSVIQPPTSKPQRQGRGDRPALDEGSEEGPKTIR